MFDVVMAVVRRKLTGRSYAAADRQHIHHRLLDRGLRPWQVLCILGAVCLTTGAAATAATVFRKDALAWITAVSLVVLMIRLRLFGHYELALLERGGRPAAEGAGGPAGSRRRPSAPPAAEPRRPGDPTRTKSGERRRERSCQQRPRPGRGRHLHPRAGLMRPAAVDAGRLRRRPGDALDPGRQRLGRGRRALPPRRFAAPASCAIPAGCPTPPISTASWRSRRRGTCCC